MSPPSILRKLHVINCSSKPKYMFTLENCIKSTQYGLYIAHRIRWFHITSSDCWVTPGSEQVPSETAISVRPTQLVHFILTNSVSVVRYWDLIQSDKVFEPSLISHFPHFTALSTTRSKKKELVHCLELCKWIRALLSLSESSPLGYFLLVICCYCNLFSDPYPNCW